MDRKNVDINALECTVYGKGKKERTVFFTSVAAMALQEYFDTRTDKHDALFVGKGSERMTPHGVRFMLTELGEEAGVENVHPHRFRRTLATSLHDHGMPIEDIKEILGHESIETTLKYIYVQKANVKNSYRKYC